MGETLETLWTRHIRVHTLRFWSIEIGIKSLAFISILLSIKVKKKKNGYKCTRVNYANGGRAYKGVFDCVQSLRCFDNKVL